MNEPGALLVVLFQVPLKPGSALRLVPGAMDALYEALVMVTELPDWVYAPFQSWVTVCPLGKLNCKLQPLMVVEPVLVMVKDALKPPGHWLVIA